MNKKHETFWAAVASTPEPRQVQMCRPNGFLSEKQQMGYLSCPAGPASTLLASYFEISPGQAPNRNCHSVVGAKASRKGSVRAQKPGDHYRQARKFHLNQDAILPEKITSALVFDLSKDAHALARGAIAWNLRYVGEDLAARVAAGLAFSTMTHALIVTAPSQQTVPRMGLFLQRPTNTNGRVSTRMEHHRDCFLNLS